MWWPTAARRSRRRGIAGRGGRVGGCASPSSLPVTARGAGIRAALDCRRIHAAGAHLFQHAGAILGREALQALGKAASAASAAAGATLATSS